MMALETVNTACFGFIEATDKVVGVSSDNETQSAIVRTVNYFWLYSKRQAMNSVGRLYDLSLQPNVTESWTFPLCTLPSADVEESRSVARKRRKTLGCRPGGGCGTHMAPISKVDSQSKN